MAIGLNIQGGLVQLSGNPIWIEVNGASVPVGATNYKLLLKVTSTDGLLLGSPFIDAIAPDANGKALFNISGIVDKPIAPEFEWPATGAIKANPAAVFNIEVEAGETYILNREQVINMGAYPEDMQILKGGVSDEQAIEYLQPFHSFFTDWISAGKFLTNQPNNPKVSVYQIAKLWWMTSNVSIFNAEWHCGVWLNHQANYIELSDDIVIDPASGLLEFNVNPIFLGLNDVYGTTDFTPYIRSFDFWLEDPAASEAFRVISEVRSFVVDQSYHENNTYIMFLNGKRGIDNLWFPGSVKSNIETTSSEAQRPVGLTDTVKIGTVLVTGKSGRRKWIVNSGYKSTEEMHALVDLFLSTHIWMVTGDQQFWDPGKTTSVIPVVLANADKLLHDTNEDLHYCELELLEARNMKFL